MLWYNIRMGRMSPNRDPSALFGRGGFKAARLGGGSCRNCGYDLRGLPADGTCPECGTPVGAGYRLLDDNLVLAPRSYLKVLAFGCVLLGLGVLGGVVSIGLSFREHGPLWLAASAFFAIYALGVWIITRPARSTVASGGSPLPSWPRWWARVSQWGWAAALSLQWGATTLSLQAIAAGGMPGGEVRSMRAGALAAAIIALLGIVPTCVHASALAGWAGADVLAERLRIAAASTLVGVLASGTSFIAINWASSGGLVWTITGAFGALFTIAGAVLLVWSMVELMGMAVWALDNSKKTIERDQRVAERRKNESQRLTHGLEGEQAVSPIAPDRPRRPGRR